MYLTRILLKNFRCFEKVDLTFENPAGWTVIAGLNGTGKSTMLQAIAIGLLDTVQLWHELPGRLVRLGADKALCKLMLKTCSDDHPPIKETLINQITLNETDLSRVARQENDLQPLDGTPDPKGWFFAAYGPFRRISWLLGCPLCQHRVRHGRLKNRGIKQRIQHHEYCTVLFPDPSSSYLNCRHFEKGLFAFQPRRRGRRGRLIPEVIPACIRCTSCKIKTDSNSGQFAHLCRPCLIGISRLVCCGKSRRNDRCSGRNSSSMRQNLRHRHANWRKFMEGMYHDI